MARHADHLRKLAADEESQAAEAIRAGDAEAAEAALQRARKLRRIAYLRGEAAAYQGDAMLNPWQEANNEPSQHRLVGSVESTPTPSSRDRPPCNDRQDDGADRIDVFVNGTRREE